MVSFGPTSIITMNSKKTGLFFGSFNPVHIGHMIIAQHVLNESDIDEIWFVVSPHNPLKSKTSLAPDHDRFFLVQEAIGDHLKMRASSVEFNLPQPSYTIDTLTYLKEKYPNKNFSLIMGGDNLKTFHKWKNHEILINNHEIYVYDRPDTGETRFDDHPAVHFFNATQMNISATHIRRLIKEGKSIQFLVPRAVFSAIHASNLYR
jgi:nicotinate-nucleotide adenylyltransferase